MDPAFLKASGKRILAGVTGVVHRNVGEITISNPAHVGVDENLVRILELAVDDLKIAIIVNSIDSGSHVPNSRHGHGCAVDMDEIGPMGHPLAPVHLANTQACELVVWLIDHGFHAGHEAGDYPAVLFGPVGTKWNQTQIPHAGHIHASLHPAAGE